MSRQKLHTAVYFLFMVLCLGVGLASAAQVAGIQPVVEWQLQDGALLSSTSGALGNTGVTVEVRTVPTSHGNRYDVRLRNRTGQDYTHAALRIRLPRAGADGSTLIEGLTVPVPAEVHQWWEAGTLDGSVYGFAYEVASGTASQKRVGPSATEGEWGGRASGIVRVDGKAYIIPEFWERQPRRITVTAKEIVLTLFEGLEPLRAGEDAWDRFAILDDVTLPDATLIAEVEGLPDLTLAQREELMQRFGIAHEGLTGQDSEAETWLRKYDQWQGTSWEKKYADYMEGREYWSGEVDPAKTTLFSLFARGWYYPVKDPGIYTWREYGDIQWACGMSNLHYDWLRSALKHYLRTGNQDALRWAMAAMKHAVSVDHLWENPAQPARTDYLNLAGLTRYEKGDHGGADFIARQTHSWVEGLFLAYTITGDSWVGEAARDLAEADWRVWNGGSPAVWDGSYDEIRMVSWPLLVQVTAFRETGDIRYWQKARELMQTIYDNEQRSGGAGYITNGSPWVGNLNNAQVLMHTYSVKAMLAFADMAISRGEWTDAYQDLLKRWATWLTTPMPKGAYMPNGTYFTPQNPDVTYGTFATWWCPAGQTCTQPNSTSGDAVHNMMVVDLPTWLAVHDPSGGNPNTGETWAQIARKIFNDVVNHSVQPWGTVGFLTNMYPTTETKALGWMQLFGDRSVQWLAAASSCMYTITPTSKAFSASGGTGSISVSADSSCNWTAVSNTTWITITAGSTGSGSRTVNYSVAANASTSSRTGNITVAGQTFTVTQQGQVCAYAISPANVSYDAATHAGSVAVTCGTGCGWWAASNASWITITAGSTGSGSGTVNYSVAANTSTSARTGTIAAAGQVLTVTQAAAAFPVISVSSKSLDFGKVRVRTFVAKTVTVSNTGTANLTVKSVTISGTNATQFTAATSCGTVAPKGSCTIQVTFLPKSAGNKSANLNISSNDPNTPVVGVALTGTGRQLF